MSQLSLHPCHPRQAASIIGENPRPHLLRDARGLSRRPPPPLPQGVGLRPCVLAKVFVLRRLGVFHRMAGRPPHHLLHHRRHDPGVDHPQQPQLRLRGLERQPARHRRRQLCRHLQHFVGQEVAYGGGIASGPARRSCRHHPRLVGHGSGCARSRRLVHLHRRRRLGFPSEASAS